MIESAGIPRGQTRNQLGASVTSRPRPPLWWALLQILALSFHVPLALLTGPQSALTSTVSVLVIGAGVMTVSVGLYLILARLLRTEWHALTLISVIIVFFWHSSASESLGPVTGPMLTVATLVLVSAAALKYADRHYFKVIAFVASIAFTGTLAVKAFVDSAGAPDAVLGVQSPVESETFTEEPDIVLIVLDGYGRSDVMREFYGYDNEPFLDTLRSRGFDVADRSIANYAITHLSIPAMLNMSYIHQKGDALGNNDLLYLAGEVGGESDFVSLLQANGYTYIHGEADHWHNVCGDRVDICLPGPTLDVTGHALLVKTPVGGLFYRETGDPTTALNLERIAQLTDWDRTSRDWPSGPRFVFLHLQLPHPPLYLDADCEVRIEAGLGGRIMNDGEISSEELDQRKAAWIEQVECANSTILTFLDQVDSDTIVVLASDHGPDAVFSLTSQPSDDGLEERFRTLAAMRLPEHCQGEFPDDINTVNLLRPVIACLSGDQLEYLESRHFLGGYRGPIFEIAFSDQT